MRIRTRSFLFLLSVYLPLLLLTLGIQYYSYRIYQKYLDNSVTEVFAVVGENFSNAMTALENVSMNVIADRAIQETLISRFYLRSDFPAMQARDEISQRLRLHSLTNRYVLGTVIVDPTGTVAIMDDPLNGMDVDAVHGSVREKVLGLGGMKYWFSEKDAKNVLVLSRLINEVGLLTSLPLGIMGIFVDIDKILVDLIPQLERHDARVALYYQSVPVYSTMEIPDDGLNGLLQELRGYSFKNLRVGGTQSFVTAGMTKNKDWTFLFAIPSGNLFIELIAFNRFLFWVYIVLSISFFLLIVRFSRNISEPIVSLSREMKNIEEHNLSPPAHSSLESRRVEEITTLYREFHLLMERIDTLVNKNLRQELALDKSRLQVLEGQLDPHFLYNTLDSLYWMAELNQQNEIALVVKSLGKLLRGSLRNSEPLVSVREEISLLNDYLYIQKIRFKDRLEYSVQVQDDAYGALLPRFSIQPLVENSIKYGLDESHALCLVEIWVKCSDGFLEIRIADTGKGMDVSGKAESGNGIGLDNLRQRISLLYGGQGTMELGTKDGRGTLVVLRLPLRHDEP